MPAPPNSLRSWTAWAWAGWSTAGVIAGVESYLNRRTYGRLTPLSVLMVARLPPWWIWAVATPFIWKLGRPTRWRAWLEHAGLFLTLSTAFAYAYALGDRWASGARTTLGQELLQDWLSWLSAQLLGYAAMVALGEALRARQARAELAVALASARLSALQSRLHPHFLFNALNTVMTFVRQQDTAAAERTLLLVSDLLRQVLRQEHAERVALREEVEGVRKYLELAQLRLGDRLRVSWEVDPSLLEVPVPAMVLQPLVENALRHGIDRREKSGSLHVRLERVGTQLRSSVQDDGAGLPANFRWEDGRGLGLRNLRERLAHHFGEGAKLWLEPVAGGGARATVELPLP